MVLLVGVLHVPSSENSVVFTFGGHWNFSFILLELKTFKKVALPFSVHLFLYLHKGRSIYLLTRF